MSRLHPLFQNGGYASRRQPHQWPSCDEPVLACRLRCGNRRYCRLPIHGCTGTKLHPVRHTMARIWKGRRTQGTLPKKYRHPRDGRSQSPMCGGFVDHPYSASPPVPSRDERLDPGLAIFVKVCGFTFEFWSSEEIEAALRYYRQKVHPGRKMPTWGEHDVTQRWYERSPQYLQANNKRQRVVKALEKALSECT